MTFRMFGNNLSKKEVVSIFIKTTFFLFFACTAL
jgi:hypothetical protein